MKLGLREELEVLQGGRPVDAETMRRVALAALRWVPPEALVQAIGQRWALHGSTARLVIAGREGVEDLTPDEGWSR